MGPINYTINQLSSKGSDWQIFNGDKLHHYTIQFPLLSKPRLINSSGECIGRIYNDQSNSFLRYIGFYESNQIFTIRLITELGECIFSPLERESTSNKLQFSWRLSRAQQTLNLIETSSGQLVAKVLCTSSGSQLASIQFYRILEDQLTLALLFSGCILLNQSKMFKSSSKKNFGLLKSNTF